MLAHKMVGIIEEECGAWGTYQFIASLLFVPQKDIPSSLKVARCKHNSEEWPK